MSSVFIGLCFAVIIFLLEAHLNVGDLVTSKRQIYKPTWESLDARPLPKWYPEAKLGIFIHWGLFSVPGVGRGAEQFWGNWINPGNETKQIQKREYMKRFHAPGFKFEDFAPQFRAEFFKPHEWARLFKKSGAK